MERKKAERERLKAEKERLKQEAKAQKEKDDATSKQSPEPEEDIVDSLLKEIRAGTKLRTTTTDTVQRPSRCMLKKEDIEKLEQMKQDNMNMKVEDLKQEINEEVTERPEKMKQQAQETRWDENCTEQKINGANTEKLKLQMNLATMATMVEDPESFEQLEEQGMHREDDTKNGENHLEQEVNGEDIRKLEEMKQEKLTRVTDNLEQEVNGGYIERAKQLKIGKQKNKAMIVEDIEQEETVVE